MTSTIKKGIQCFDDDYLERCRHMTAEAIVDYLEDFRKLQSPSEKTKLISIRVPENLLNTFRKRCDLEGEKYQAQIKLLMQAWLEQK
jgi:predicted DNA binding CopG/RHH family protein